MAKTEKRYIDIKVTSNIDGVTKKASKNADGLGKGLKGVAAGAVAATTGIRSMTAALVSSGIGAIAVALGSVVSFFGKTLNVSMDFAAELSRLKGITGATADEIEELSDNAKELGATTEFTAQQVVGLQVEFAKLGFSTDEILNATSATLDLAAASGTDLANAAEVAGSTLRAFGLDTSQTQRVVDVMADSFRSSALDMTKFQESMKLVAPIAKTTKVSIEEASAATAILANQGLNASLAGTALRRIIGDLVTVTGKDFNTALKETAVRLNNASSDADKLAIATDMVGFRAKGSLIALADNVDQLDELTLQFNNAGGAAREMADENLDNLRGDLIKLKSAFEGLMLSVEDGDGLMTLALRNIVKNFTSLLQYIPDRFDRAFTLMGARFVVFKESVVDIGETFRIFLRRSALKVKSFGLNIKEFLKDVPFFGTDATGIETERAQIEYELTQLDAASDQLAKNAKKRSAYLNSIYMGFAELQEKNEERITKARKTIYDPFSTGGEEETEAERAARSRREKFLRDIEKLKDEVEDDSRLSRLQRRKQDALDELAEIELDETRKQELRKEIILSYDALIKREQDRLDAEQADQRKKDIEEYRDIQRRAEEENIAMKIEAADHVQNIFAEETAAFKAMQLLKNALMIQEIILRTKAAIAQATIDAAEAQQKGFSGAAKALTSGNPIRIALAVASIAAVVAQSIAMMKKTKDAANKMANVAGAGGGGGGGSVAPPSFNIIGSTSAGDNLIAETVERANSRPLKAYVVESEMESAAAIARNTRSIASLG